MRTRRGFRWAAAVVLIAATPSRAWGDDRAVREAQARFEEGLKRVKAGDFEAARMSFLQAYVVLHKPDILWNLALSEEKSGRPVDALGHFKELARDASDDADRVRARKHVDALMPQTGHIEVLAPAGTPLSLDGAASIGTAPLADAVDVTPGHHVIDGKLAEGTKEIGVDAVAGQVARVSFVVTGADPTAPAAAPAPAPVLAPASAIAPVPVTPAPPVEEPPSAHSAARLAVTTALGAGAVIALGLGVYFGLQSRSDANTAAGYGTQLGPSGCVNPAGAVVTECAHWNDVVKEENRDQTVSTVLYVTGGVLVAGAVAAWFLWPRSSEAKGFAWVVPAAGPTGGGVVAGGRF